MLFGIFENGKNCSKFESSLTKTKTTYLTRGQKFWEKVDKRDPWEGIIPRMPMNQKGTRKRKMKKVKLPSIRLVCCRPSKATTVESRFSEPFGSSTETSPNRVSSLCLQQFYKAHKCQQQQFLH